MPDGRELILQRIVAICETVTGIVTVVRNPRALDDLRLPAIVIMDGDETGNENDPTTHRLGAPRRMIMTPELHLSLKGLSETIGTDINAMRAEVLNKVLLDTELESICSDNGYIRYGGMGVALKAGAQILPVAGIVLEIQYVLYPHLLLT